MGAIARYLTISSLLFGLEAPVCLVIHRRYGREAGTRFAAGTMATLAAQQALVGVAIRGNTRGRGHHRLSVVDAITLTRGAAAATLVGVMVSGVRDRHGAAGRLGWLALLYGAVLCDWLDGPIARHLGTSEVGALIDLEADSWLTLCAAGSAIAWGELHPSVAIAPLLRYALLARALGDVPYAEVHVDEPRWVRPLGIAQMLLFIGALAPFRGRATSWLVRRAAPIQSPLQVLALLVLHARRRRARR